MRKKLLPNVFMWLFIGLLVTFLCGYYVSTKESFLEVIYENNLYWIFIVAELALAMVFSINISEFKKSTALILYFIYTILTGITTSFIFRVYSIESIIIVFLIAAGLFGLFAFIGKVTKIDLSKIWIYLLIGFVGLAVLWIINAFIASEKLNMITSIVGLIIFIGYTAYDVQRIARSEDLEDVEDSNYPILFAFSLFIDFINIFLDLLNLFGEEKK